VDDVVLYEALGGRIAATPAAGFMSRRTHARLADGRTVLVATALLEGKMGSGALGECDVCSGLFPRDPDDPLNQHLFGPHVGPTGPYRAADASRCAEHGGAPRG
jgi:hypothetical protein